jgi:hypothetical protein
MVGEVIHSVRTPFNFWVPQSACSLRQKSLDKKACIQKLLCRSNPSSSGDGGPSPMKGGGPINEDLIARLRAAEEEVGTQMATAELYPAEDIR